MAALAASPTTRIFTGGTCASCRATEYRNPSGTNNATFATTSKIPPDSMTRGRTGIANSTGSSVTTAVRTATYTSSAVASRAPVSAEAFGAASATSTSTGTTWRATGSANRNPSWWVKWLETRDTRHATLDFSRDDQPPRPVALGP